MSNQVFNTFWYGPDLPPMHWACLDSFVKKGHTLRVFAYQDLALPDGAILEDANRVVDEKELFEFEESFSAFSNIFRYTLLLEQGGWWVDTDVYCCTMEIPDCRYAWAWQDEDNINGAILKFPAGDPALASILDEALAIGPDIEVWGEMGPQLLTRHLAGREFPGFFGDTRAFYSIHWLETHMFWMPAALRPVLSRTADSPFIHLWASCFKAFGIDPHLTPPRGSFLHEIYQQADIMDQMPPLDEETDTSTRLAIAEHLAKPWVGKRAQRVLGYEPKGYDNTRDGSTSRAKAG